MQTMMRLVLKTLALTLLLLPQSCGSKSSDDADEVPALAGDAETPPTGATNLESWLTEGSYKSWTCEAAAHDQRSPSPHGKNRICSNKLLSEAGPGEFPVGSAAVKELYDDAGTSITGYAVYRHTTAGTEGKDWYWYERAGSDVVANGLGSTGSPKSICVNCHAGAGSDAGHSGHDFVYTQVLTPPSAELPPEGAAAITAWLAEGSYKSWKCEAAPHDDRPGGAHGRAAAMQMPPCFANHMVRFSR